MEIIMALARLAGLGVEDGVAVVGDRRAPAFCMGSVLKGDDQVLLVARGALQHQFGAAEAIAGIVVRFALAGIGEHGLGALGYTVAWTV